MSRHTTPDQKAQIVTLRSAGYSLPSIAEKVGVSLSTVKRHIKSIPKGSIKQEIIEEAQKELLSTLSDSAVKKELAALVRDDLILTHRIRSSIFNTLEHIEKHSPTDAHEAGQIMRALSSAATGLKLTGDALRQSLGINQRGLHESNTDDLPDLTIRDMTSDEMHEIRKRSEARSTGVDDGLGGILTEKNEVLTEGFEESDKEPEAA